PASAGRRRIVRRPCRQRRDVIEIPRSPFVGETLRMSATQLRHCVRRASVGSKGWLCGAALLAIIALTYLGAVKYQANPMQAADAGKAPARPESLPAA